MDALSPLRTEFEGLRETENRKDRLIEDLFGYIDVLRQTLSVLQVDFEQKNDLAGHYQTKLKESQEELRVKQRMMDGTPYVSVLIDGDSLNFVDRFVMNREAGGQDAARQLKSAVLEYVRNVEDGAVGFDVRIVVRVYANFKGLGKTYQGAKILENANDLYLFARGFNMGDQLCDFIDAGDGKECADVKIGEHFKSDVSNVHCKRIIFGGPADNGYARLLSPYSGDAAVSKRITMVEGPPFAFELRSLAEKFPTTSFTSIFRKTKLPTRKVSFSETPPTSPVPTYASAAAVTSNNANNGNKSPRMSPIPAEAVLAPPTSPPLPQILPVQLEQHQYQYQHQHQHQKKQLMMPVYQNNKGERVDMPLKPVEGIIKLLKQRRLCYQYHLLGDCGYNTCTHGHGTRLSSARELEALRFMARLSPCGIGLGCDLETCVAGHQCPRPGCQGGDCRFPREMHGVDKRIHN